MIAIYYHQRIGQVFSLTFDMVFFDMVEEFIFTEPIAHFNEMFQVFDEIYLLCINYQVTIICTSLFTSPIDLLIFFWFFDWLIKWYLWGLCSMEDAFKSTISSCISEFEKLFWTNPKSGLQRFQYLMCL